MMERRKLGNGLYKGFNGFNGWILNKDTAIPCPYGELGFLIIGIRLRIVARLF
jgi:hypothetical protein